MKYIVNGKIILKDRIVEGSALLYSDVIEGILPADKLPENVEIIDIEKEIPVYLTEIKEVEKPLSKWQTYKMQMGVMFMVLLGIGIVLNLIKYLINHFKL